jgi:hypothetical protein
MELTHGDRFCPCAWQATLARSSGTETRDAPAVSRLSSVIKCHILSSVCNCNTLIVPSQLSDAAYPADFVNKLIGALGVMGGADTTAQGNAIAAFVFKNFDELR